MNRTWALIRIALIGLAALGPVRLSLNPALAQEKKAAPVDLAGTWDTSWGFATLQTTPMKGKRLMSVTGSYVAGKNMTGVIKSGTYDPETRILEINFFEAWQGDSNGAARLTMAPDGNHFKGTFKQGSMSGDLSMSRVRGHDFASRVDSIVADAGIRPDAPGAAVLVVEHGKPIFEKCYGLANIKEKRQITPQTTFELASCSKQFTGTAILLLFERGKLALNDDVRKYLPELPEYDKANPIRILHLAHHTSGLPEYMDFPDVKGKNPNFLTNEDYVGEFARHRKKFPLYFPTGTKERYTNTNYMLLALIVERVAKRPFAAFLKTEIFEPLGMKTAAVYENPKVNIKEPALGYHKEKGGFHTIWGVPPYRHETALEVGDGSVWASLDDMKRWDDGWREGKVLKAETIKKALVQSKIGKDQTVNYAFGWGLTVEDGKLVSMAHNGGWGGFHTFVDRNLTDERTLIVLSNGDNLDVDMVSRLFRAMPPKGK